MKSEASSGIKRKAALLWKVLPWLWLIAGLLLTVVLIATCNDKLLNSDSASEMLLANSLNQTGNWVLTDQWCYSTELRVAYIQLVFRVALLLFPQNWTLARAFSVGVMLLFLVGSYLLLARKIGLSQWGAWSAAMLVWPLSQEYVWLLLTGCSYLPYCFFTFLSVWLLLNAVDSTQNKTMRIAAMSGLVAMAFVTGLAGIRQLMVCHLPLMATALLLLFFELRKNKVEKLRELPSRCALGTQTVMCALAATVAGATGYLVNSHWLCKYYMFQKTDGNAWASFDFDRIATRIGEFFMLLGYRRTVLFSLQGIFSACGLVIAFLVVFSAARLIWRYETLHWGQQLILVLSLCAFGISALIMGMTDAGYVPRYWIPILPFTFLLLQMEWETENYSLEISSKAIALLMATAVTVCGASIWQEAVAYKGTSLKKATDWLVEQGYTQGYATFWNSNSATELSSGQLEFWIAYTPSDFSPYPWLQQKYHLEQKPQGQVFLLYSDNEADEVWRQPYAFLGQGVYQQEGYTVLIFDNADLILENYVPE